MRIVEAGSEPAPAERPGVGSGGPSGGDAQVATTLSDAELIAAVVRGDHRVSNAIYQRLCSPIERSILRVFRRREPNHDDMVQAAFEQVIQSLARGRFDGRCSLRSWAGTLAANHAINALASRRVERRVMSDAELSPEASGADPERQYAARDQIDWVLGHLARLERSKALTVFLFEVLGHDLREVAELTGTTVAAAQSRLVRGRKELLERLNEPGEQEP